MQNILFVCLGNICRSPLAEALLNYKARKQNLQHNIRANSAATSNYEVGNPPDARTLKNAASHGLQFTHTARQITLADALAADKIIVMDNSHVASLKTMFANQDKVLSKVEKAGKYLDPVTEPDIQDPWYGNAEDFETVYQQLDVVTTAIINQVKNNTNPCVL